MQLRLGHNLGLASAAEDATALQIHDYAALLSWAVQHSLKLIETESGRVRLACIRQEVAHIAAMVRGQIAMCT